MSLSLRIAGLLVLAAVPLAWGQAPAAKPDTAPEPDHWMILFRSDKPALWNTSAKDADGVQVAIPISYAPLRVRYLRLRRMDTDDALILPISRDQLLNDKARDDEAAYWWNGTAKKEWKGRHLGIAQGPRHKFPVPNGMICVMNEGWDGFAGSGFGHKAFANDGQYFCWRGRQIPRTEFEIAVSEGPLSPEERRFLVARR